MPAQGGRLPVTGPAGVGNIPTDKGTVGREESPSSVEPSLPMIERLLDIFGQLGNWGYLIVFLMPFLESAAFTGLLVPGETVVVLAGFLSSQGYLDLGNCLAVISLAVILGDTAGYALGKTIGRGTLKNTSGCCF